jgi:hypothetical protein
VARVQEVREGGVAKRQHSFAERTPRMKNTRFDRLTATAASEDVSAALKLVPRTHLFDPVLEGNGRLPPGRFVQLREIRTRVVDVH